MSRERAQRREERERAAAVARADRERRAARQARREARSAAVRARLVPRRIRWRGQQGVLARRRRTENAVIAILWLAAEGLVWLLTSDPWLRGAALLLGVLALPVLVTLTLDRRSR